MEELHQVVSAEPLDGMRVLVSFENGVRGIFDCEYLTKDSYWAKLKSPAFSDKSVLNAERCVGQKT